TSAMNIRQNQSQFVKVPEWQRAYSVNPEDSVAAYAIKETAGNTITIRAKFSCDTPTTNPIEVRTAYPPPPHLTARWSDTSLQPLAGVSHSLQFPDPYALRRLWLALQSCIGNILGEVKSRQITFQPNGETDFEVFELRNVQIWSRGVGIHDVEWR